MTQTLKLRYPQYLGNHMKLIFWPITHLNPNCTLYPINAIDTKPHVLSICENQHIEGLRISRHNKAVHLIARTLQANKSTQFFTLIILGTHNNKPPNPTIPEWILNCTYMQPPCQCLAKLRLGIICILGASNQSQPPLTPYPTHTFQFVEFTYCHDKFHVQALEHKHTKYDPLINTIQNHGWTINPLIAITAGVRGAIHKHSMPKLNKLTPPPLEPTSQNRHNALYCIMCKHDQSKANMLIFTTMPLTHVLFSLL